MASGTKMESDNEGFLNERQDLLLHILIPEGEYEHSQVISYFALYRNSTSALLCENRRIRRLGQHACQ